VLYDEFFPASRYDSEPWYGGGYRNNKNSYQLFSMGGLDFLIIHLEWQPPDDILDWANNVVASYPDRRAILTTHDFLDSYGNRSTTIHRTGGNAGEDIWQELVRGNCNFFMVLSGHYHFTGGEARLTSANDCGESVHQVLQNYQHRENGGDGWLRYYEFRPYDNAIQARTYTPTYDQFETDWCSEFVLDYPMGGTPFDLLDTKFCVPSDTRVSTLWENLDHATRYQWYVTVKDSICTTTGPRWVFTTEQDCTNPSTDDETCDAVDDDCDGSYDEDYDSTGTTCGHGECAGNVGAMTCVEGEVVDTCDPFQGAVEEICDGLDNDCDRYTDESFADTDGDGWMDCIDPDDEGDEIPDGQDNCPLIFNPNQADFDDDGVGDVCDGCPEHHDPDQIDSDEDTVGDACDNCLWEKNLSQVDLDSDGEGDRCDVDDGQIHIFFDLTDMVEWDPEQGFDSWNLYRGDMAYLREYGSYTQAPVVPDAERYCDLTTPQCPDTVVPPDGKTYFFLATGVANGWECSLGTDSGGGERPNTNPCP
jgi:hypothetical protein